MKKVLINYGGAIVLYLVIFIGIVAVSERLTYINNYDTQISINK